MVSPVVSLLAVAVLHPRRDDLAAHLAGVDRVRFTGVVVARLVGLAALGAGLGMIVRLSRRLSLIHI